MINMKVIIYDYNYIKIKMHYQSKLKKQFDWVIQRPLLAMKNGLIKMVQALFNQAQSSQFNQILTIISQTLLDFTKQATPIWLNNIQTSVQSKLKLLNQRFQYNLSQAFEQFIDESALFYKKRSQIKFQQMIVKLERQEQNDKNIQNQQKNERSRFFTLQIQKKLNEANATLQQQKEIISLFISKQAYIDLDNLGKLTKYRRQIQQLKQQLQQINEYYQKKKKECLPIQQIITHRFNSLKVIRIQYQTKINNFYRYSISAFQLLQVMHSNKLLNQVTIKGVYIEQFQRIAKYLNTTKNHQPTQQGQNNDLSRMKGIKLAINAKIKFDIKNKKSIESNINNLMLIVETFCSISDIDVEIYLDNLSTINQWAKYLQDLWRCLQNIKNIKIKIKKYIQGRKYEQIVLQSLSVVGLILFGRLATFTQIVQLSFQGIIFSSKFRIKDFIMVQEHLRTLFRKNKVIKLKLYDCTNFPVFPQITTLQSIDLSKTSFRNKFGFMGNAVRTNLSLKYIKCLSVEQEWRIDQNLLNQLQTLIIWDCEGVSFGDISSQSPSNLKYLSISRSNICKVGYLFVILHKMVNLVSILLQGIDFGYQLLCLIPSPKLEELRIFNNNKMNDNDLAQIDSKWPLLNSIQLSQCRKITEVVWIICKFKGLTQLHAERVLLGERNKIPYLKNKGIKVYFF